MNIFLAKLPIYEINYDIKIYWCKIFTVESSIFQLFCPTGGLIQVVEDLIPAECRKLIMQGFVWLPSLRVANFVIISTSGIFLEVLIGLKDQVVIFPFVAICLRPDGNVLHSKVVHLVSPFFKAWTLALCSKPIAVFSLQWQTKLTEYQVI